ncbi:uncharacterized protein LOC9636378 [Selaginella moellendorffii]|nr:uncharacterized protein LOC9636378 [Selaginella moellendorffii]XP_024519029.1 uncharacterized protein LOC9636378 [Selaginella moellendorffii]XP_024519030.1 uncharacterized protein LOC9636378 [Selaginella moellendorffii]XP_024519031.1 uncharacterized protein LOC9636378 [Selaginella moellendorffii]XP_024519032.1 uncharacterized protein LOC9636378 [Selaginella moellendorffii]|eukprot:XP_002989561.2 uncharacterized protein LOC9636378 [Selaginella moellendorffii]
MFQNGMSEEVQNYFVQEDASPARPYRGDQGIFRNQFVDARTQMMGHQHFSYAGAALPHKIPNGDFFDPRLQNRGQFHQQQQQQQFFDPVLQQQQQHQQFFDPVLQHHQQQQQQQQAFYDQSFQAMQMEKLRHQELLLGQGQGHGLGIQQLARAHMGTPQVDSYPIRNASIQPAPLYGFPNDMNQQRLVGKHMEAFNGAQSESEAIDMNDLFGGVEKLFADDSVQESKSAIPGFGSLGASLINGCEAELFGDGGTPFFGRGMQKADNQEAFRPAFSLGMQDSSHRPSSADGGTQFLGRGMQKAESQEAFRQNFPTGMQDSNHRPSSGDGGSSFFGRGMPKADTQEAFRPAFSLGMQDSNHRPSSGGAQVRFSQNSSEGGPWLKDTTVPTGELGVNRPAAPFKNPVSKPAFATRQFFPKAELRSPALADNIRPASAQTSDNSNIFQSKDKDEVLAAKVFESSAQSKPTGAGLISSPLPLQTPSQQERQVLQSSSKRLGSDIHRISRDYSWQTTSMFGHAQHKPVESDSIYDVVQLQHQNRVSPAASQAPPVQSTKPPEPQLKQITEEANQQGGGAALPASNFTTLGHSKPATPQQLLQVPKDMQPVDMQKSQNVSASSKPDFKSTADEQVVANQHGGQMLSVSTAASSFTTMAHSKLQLQVPKDVHPVESQQRSQMQVPKDVQPVESQQRSQNAATSVQPGKSEPQLTQDLQSAADEQPLPELANQQSAQSSFGHEKLVASQQLLQVPNDLQPPQKAPQVSLHQQRVQAALQAYALAKGGLVPQGSEQAGTSTIGPGKSSSDSNAQGNVGQAMKQQLLLNSTFASSVLPKKRKVEVPPLIPWRTAISQLTGALPTIRPAELQWATDTNRLPEKDIDEEYYAQDESFHFVARAKQRLKLTTQLMQNSLPPVPAALMQSSSVEDRECAMYVLARLSLGEACRITANEDGPQAKTNTIAATSELIAEGFKDRIKYLERVLQRLDTLPLTQEFVKNMQYLDKVCVTNRLMKCHQELFPVNFTSQRRIQQVQRSCPQPYVTVIPMPSAVFPLPEEFQLVSL